MAGSIDPRVNQEPSVRVAASPSADPCGWCFGAGKYLEALDCDVEHVYLPVVCQGCGGSGRRTL